MNVATLIERMRSEVLDDDIEPYLWSNTNLINYLNRIMNELAEETLVIVDQTTTAITQIKLLSNLGIYSLSDLVLEVRHARLSVNHTNAPLTRTSEDRLNSTVTDWRTTVGTPSQFAPAAAKGYLTVYPKFDDTGEIIGTLNISFVALTKTISKTGGDFSDLAVGDEIYVSGTTSNNGYFTVATAGTTSFTVTVAPVDETDKSATIRKVRDTLLMTVNRMLLTPFAVSDIAAATDITDIRSLYHDGLMEGMAKWAFLKPDSETYDKTQAEYYRGLFEVFKKKVKRDIIVLNKPDKSRAPRSGTSIYY